MEAAAATFGTLKMMSMTTWTSIIQQIPRIGGRIAAIRECMPVLTRLWTSMKSGVWRIVRMSAMIWVRLLLNVSFSFHSRYVDNVHHILTCCTMLARNCIRLLSV